jgi:hypothetical protein
LLDDLLRRVGNETITNISVCRTPVQGIIQKLVNWLSLGALNRAMKNLNMHDTLFHLFLIITTSSGKHFKLEKNETINVVPGLNYNGGSCMGVYLKGPITVRQFVENGLKYAGPERFYTYRGLSWNCQRWVSDMLNGSGLMYPGLDRFVNQPVEQLAKQIPGITQTIMNAITDFAARARTLQGKGKKKWIQKALNPAHKGLLRALASKQGEMTRRVTIKASWLKRTASEGGPVGKRARLALTLRKFHGKGHFLSGNQNRRMSVPVVPHGWTYGGGAQLSEPSGIRSFHRIGMVIPPFFGRGCMGPNATSSPQACFWAGRSYSGKKAKAYHAARTVRKARRKRRTEVELLGSGARIRSGAMKLTRVPTFLSV